MTSIPIEALKGKTIKEIRELIRQAESLPENHIPSDAGDNAPISSVREDTSEGAKPKTAQELLEEIENEG